MPPLAKGGFAVALAAFTVIVALGFSRQTIEVDATTVDCGSVFSPTEEPRCDEIRSDRNTLMLVIGVPGVALGLVLVVVARRMDAAS